MKIECRKCSKAKERNEFYEYDSRICKQCRRDKANSNILKLDSRVRLWRSARARAKRDNIEFNIEIEDIVVPAKCPIFGVPLVQGNRRWAPSLDRIVNAKGYVVGNVAVISNKANSLKSDATCEQLEKLAIYTRCVEPVDASIAKQVIREKRKKLFAPSRTIFMVKNDHDQVLRKTGRFGGFVRGEVVSWSSEIAAQLWIDLVSTREDLSVVSKEIFIDDISKMVRVS